MTDHSSKAAVYTGASPDEVYGLDNLLSALDDLLEEKDLERVIGASITEGLEPVVKDAQQMAPRDQLGRIPAAIRVVNVKTRVKGRVEKGVTAYDKKKVGTHMDSYFWIFQEYGTQNMPAHPFLRPALDVNRDEALKRFAQGVDARFEKLLEDKLK